MKSFVVGCRRKKSFWKDKNKNYRNTYCRCEATKFRCLTQPRGCNLKNKTSVIFVHYAETKSCSVQLFALQIYKSSNTLVSLITNWPIYFSSEGHSTSLAQVQPNLQTLHTRSYANFAICTFLCHTYHWPGFNFTFADVTACSRNQYKCLPGFLHVNLQKIFWERDLEDYQIFERFIFCSSRLSVAEKNLWPKITEEL